LIASPVPVPPGSEPGPGPGQPWWRLELLALPELEESLLWKLQALGIHRVALEHTPRTPDQRQLLAWLPAVDWPEPERRQLEVALAALSEPFGLTLPAISWRQQGDEDWSLSWKQHWQADPVGDRLLVLPAWLECPAEFADRLAIRIDPGNAFGTGSHPTTRLCLEALERWADGPGAALTRPVRVADLGCGSGILALAALKLLSASDAPGAAARRAPAAQVFAVDSDPLAVRATGANAACNGVVVPGAPGTRGAPLEPGGQAASLQVAQGSVEGLAELLAGEPADLLLCNILAPVIEALAPAFATVLAPGGVGLLSGLLVSQVPGLTQALATAGWRAELVAQQSQWGLLEIRSARRVA
jgi:ribosomal protein L11 methyltransferase